MDTFIVILGLIGAVLVVLMYLLLQLEKVVSTSLIYSVVNGIGALLVLVSVAYSYDFADTGAVFIQVVWVIISLYGVYRYFRERKNAHNQ